MAEKSMRVEIKSWMRKLLNSQEFIVLLPLLILCVGATLYNPNFLRLVNLGAMARILAPWGLLAIGVSMIIITGEIDISVGSMVSLGTVLFAFMIDRMGIPVILAMLIICIVTMTLSTISAFCIVKLKVPAFLTTIAMLYICMGFASALTNARAIPIYTSDLIHRTGAFQRFGQMQFGNVNWAFVLFVVLVIVFQFILKKTSYGRKVYATGDNIRAAALSGIRVDRIKFSVFLISGLLVGLASILVVGSEGVGSARYGEGWELNVIAATAIGGISLVGGSGTMIGTMIGVFIMAVISNLMILTRVNQHYQAIILGVIIALSVVLDVRRRNKLLGK